LPAIDVVLDGIKPPLHTNYFICGALLCKTSFTPVEVRAKLEVREDKVCEEKVCLIANVATKNLKSELATLRELLSRVSNRNTRL
jgi:hypothetical protein